MRAPYGSTMRNTDPCKEIVDMARDMYNILALRMANMN
jgi:hypothetical protein